MASLVSFGQCQVLLCVISAAPQKMADWTQDSISVALKEVASPDREYEAPVRFFLVIIRVNKLGVATRWPS